MYYAHFKCPYCKLWWPEECKCDLVAATLAQQLSEAQIEIAALKQRLKEMTDQRDKWAEEVALALRPRLVEAERLLNIVTWRTQVHLSDCDCADCEAVERFLLTPTNPDYVLVRRKDLEVVETYEGQLRSAAFWSDDKEKIDRLKAALGEKP